MAKLELVVNAKAKLGEGAIWDNRAKKLCWVDIEQNRLHIHDPATGVNEVHDVGQMVGTVVPRKRGGYALALHHGLGAFDPGTRKLEIFCDPDKNPNVRFNDGKCDPSGRFWAGTLPMNADAGKPICHLYRLDADKTCHTILDGILCSNGIVWTRDRKTMYYIDSPTLKIEAFDYDDATGSVTNRRTAYATKKTWGYPDGMAIDEQDHLWVAFWGGFAVRCIDPKAGKMVKKIDVPAPRVTSCAFGGPNLDELYITTSWSGLNDAERATYPQSGGLFRIKPGAQGVPTFEYAG